MLLQSHLDEVVALLLHFDLSQDDEVSAKVANAWSNVSVDGQDVVVARGRFSLTTESLKRTEQS